jgi:hypothetical protein
MSSESQLPETQQSAGPTDPAGAVPGKPALPSPRKRRSRQRQALLLLVGLILAYLLVAYFIVPLGWIRYAHRHPAWEDAPRITHTIADIPGDPLNVALVGTEAEVKKVLLAAGWYPADSLTLKSSLEMAEAAVLKRTYKDAPVSNLFLFGRKEDLAFEQPVGDNPRKRHHVRFWKWDKLGPDDRPVWFGSATYDERVGLSHTTGQITHHIAPDLDTERDHLIHDLEQTGALAEVYSREDFQQVHEGRNGGGDPWHTDGNLSVAVIKPATAGSPP